MQYLYRWSTTKDTIHSWQFFFGSDGDDSKKTHLLEVDVSIIN
jgi:hypothetical protein